MRRRTNPYDKMRVSAVRSLRAGYAEELDEIAKVLIRAKIITRRDVQRHGVHFAVEFRFDPSKRHMVDK